MTNRRSILAACFLLLISFSLAAIESARLQIGSMQYADIDLTQLDITFSFDSKGLVMQAMADKFILMDQQLNNVVLNCQQFKIGAKFWQCGQGQLRFSHDLLGQQQLALSFTANTLTQHYQLTIDNLAIANGLLQVRAKFKNTQWQGIINGQKLNVGELLALLTKTLPDKDLTIINNWQPNGEISGSVNLSGRDIQLFTSDIQLNSPDFSFSDKSGNHVAETLNLDLSVTVKKQHKWLFESEFALKGGQSYWTPVFLDFKKTPVKLSLNGLMDPQNQHWQFQDIKFQQQDVLSAIGALQFQQNKLEQLALTLQPSSLGAIYQWWLQPYTAGTAVANLTAEGQIGGQLQWQDDQLQAQADLKRLSISDTAGRFAVEDLNGHFAWTTRSTAVPINLSWQHISIGALPINASNLHAEVVDNQLSLTEDLELPLLDGGLRISNFHYQYNIDGSRWKLAGLLKPLSMQALTQALHWPRMDGKLSGVIPYVSYQDQKIDIDGALLVKVFDGTAIVKDLQLQSPFGSLPQLTANIDMQQLDLELLTQTFDFGKISGRLDGKISGLRLSNWQPVQFDARFVTSVDNPGKRRISQRAVDNLSQIGGGASGLMSRSFLRFFEDFSYKKLGIRCQLNNEICQMSGIEDNEQGYYIVKGGGMPPWINVIGYTRRVDWPDLLARLQAVKSSDGPIFE